MSLRIPSIAELNSSSRSASVSSGSLSPRRVSPSLNIPTVDSLMLQREQSPTRLQRPNLDGLNGREYSNRLPPMGSVSSSGRVSANLSPRSRPGQRLSPRDSDRLSSRNRSPSPSRYHEHHHHDHNTCHKCGHKGLHHQTKYARVRDEEDRHVTSCPTCGYSEVTTGSYTRNGYDRSYDRGHDHHDYNRGYDAGRYSRNDGYYTSDKNYNRGNSHGYDCGCHACSTKY